MTKIEIYTAHAMDLFHRHGLSAAGWTFRIVTKVGTSASTLGMCKHATKTIQVLNAHVQNDSHAAIMDTILHEIAHAIVGPGKGHGPVWRAAASRIGANPRATSSVKSSEETKKFMYKYRLAIKHADGTIERLNEYTNRRTKLDGYFAKNRRDTMNMLAWVDNV